MTQTELALAYIDQYGSITARIADLKKSGVPIWTEMRNVNGRRFAEYGVEHS